MVWSCGICFEDGKAEAGEIDACFHRFCYQCIIQWSGSENTCPFCKVRFHVIRRKKLGDPQQPDPGPNEPLEGEVTEVVDVQDRNQTITWAEPIPAFLATLHCEICRTEQDEELLLICDGCNAGYHTYCMNLPRVPDGDWFCPRCTQQRSNRRQGERQTGEPVGSAAGTRRRRQATPPPNNRVTRRRLTATPRTIVIDDDDIEEDELEWDSELDADDEDELNEEDIDNLDDDDDDGDAFFISAGHVASVVAGLISMPRAGNRRVAGRGRRNTNNTVQTAGSDSDRPLARLRRGAMRTRAAAATGTTRAQRVTRAATARGNQASTSSRPPSASSATPPAPARVPVVAGLRAPRGPARTLGGMRSLHNAAAAGQAATRPPRPAPTASAPSAQSQVDGMAIFEAITGRFQSMYPPQTSGGAANSLATRPSSVPRPPSANGAEDEAWRRVDAIRAPAAAGGRSVAGSLVARQRAAAQLSRLQAASSSGGESSGGRHGGQPSQLRRPSVRHIREPRPVLTMADEPSIPPTPSTANRLPPRTATPDSHAAPGSHAVNQTTAVNHNNAVNHTAAGTSRSAPSAGRTTAAGSRLAAPAPFLITGTARGALQTAGRVKPVDPADREAILRAVQRLHNPPSRLRQQSGCNPSTTSPEGGQTARQVQGTRQEEPAVGTGERQCNGASQEEGRGPQTRQETIVPDSTPQPGAAAAERTDKVDQRSEGVAGTVAHTGDGFSEEGRGVTSEMREERGVTSEVGDRCGEKSEMEDRWGVKSEVGDRHGVKSEVEVTGAVDMGAGPSTHAAVQTPSADPSLPAAKRQRVNAIQPSGSAAHPTLHVADAPASVPCSSDAPASVPCSSEAAPPPSNPRRLAGLSSSFIPQEGRHRKPQTAVAAPQLPHSPSAAPSFNPARTGSPSGSQGALTSLRPGEPSAVAVGDDRSTGANTVSVSTVPQVPAHALNSNSQDLKEDEFKNDVYDVWEETSADGMHIKREHGADTARHCDDDTVREHGDVTVRGHGEHADVTVREHGADTGRDYGAVTGREHGGTMPADVPCHATRNDSAWLARPHENCTAELKTAHLNDSWTKRNQVLGSPSGLQRTAANWAPDPGVQSDRAFSRRDPHKSAAETTCNYSLTSTEYPRSNGQACNVRGRGTAHPSTGTPLHPIGVAMSHCQNTRHLNNGQERGKMHSEIRAGLDDIGRGPTTSVVNQYREWPAVHGHDAEGRVYDTPYQHDVARNAQESMFAGDVRAGPGVGNDGAGPSTVRPGYGGEKNELEGPGDHGQRRPAPSTHNRDRHNRLRKDKRERAEEQHPRQHKHSVGEKRRSEVTHRTGEKRKEKEHIRVDERERHARKHARHNGVQHGYWNDRGNDCGNDRGRHKSAHVPPKNGINGEPNIKAIAYGEVKEYMKVLLRERKAITELQYKTALREATHWLYDGYKQGMVSQERLHEEELIRMATNFGLEKVQTDVRV